MPNGSPTARGCAQAVNDLGAPHPLQGVQGSEIFAPLVPDDSGRRAPQALDVRAP